MVDVRASNTWKAVLGDLQLQVARPIYDTWLKDTIGLSLDANRLTVEVPTSFATEWLERRMYHLIQKTALKVTDLPLEIQFQVSVSDLVGREIDEGWDDEPREGVVASSAPHHSLNHKYTFKSFVVGPSNQLSYNAAMAVAEAPGHSYNPLFIYSGVGLGKTHLLHAIAQYCVSKGRRTLYVTCEQFTNEFIAAIRSRTTEEFRARYRGVEVLLIDDVQFISGKEQTQEGFFHTFNDLHNADRQVVLTSDRPPKAMHLLEDRLVSRFEWGLIADIQPPDLETRLAILRAKADQMTVDLDDSIIEYLARKVQKNVRELEGSLNRLVAYSQLTQQPIGMDLVSQVVADFMQNPARRAVDPGCILDEVTRRYRINLDALASPSRKKDIVRARHVAMYLLHEELGLRDTDIGRQLGGRDHSTVISAVGKISSQINVDAGLRQDILAIKEALYT